MKKIILFAILLVVSLSGKTVFADSNPTSLKGFTVYPDIVNYWPTWGNNSSDDNIDYIGVPDFIQTDIKLENEIYYIRFDYTARNNSLSNWDILKPGGLFIDINSDQIWDVYLDSRGKINAQTIDIYQINIPLRSSLTYSFTQLLSGEYREDHPNSLLSEVLLNSILLGSADFGGWEKPEAINKYRATTFSFDKNLIDLTNKFTVGFTVNCANDVIYQEVNMPVPIPGTLFLLGSGLLGLISIKRKNK